MDGSWDYIVVGAGSAGCVVARRLSDRRDLRVLVLEAGDRDWSPYLQVPAGRIRMNVKYDWNYPAEPDPTSGRQDRELGERQGAGRDEIERGHRGLPASILRGRGRRVSESGGRFV